MLVDIPKYAKLSDCTQANIGYRIKKGYIKLSKKKLPDGKTGKYIDTSKFPPLRIRRKKLKVESGKLKVNKPKSKTSK